MTRIGPYLISGKAVLAPMAGVTDLPFRQVCREMGAALVTAEMAASNPLLRNTLKSQLRLAQADEVGPRIVQIVGTEPGQMAEAAAYQVAAGAQIVDINMGCPAKKVCKKLAGSALMKDQSLVKKILHAVVGAVDVPVTLKIRTGWDQTSRNAVEIAKIAEASGIQSLAVHGRTRACRFKGEAEYDTISDVVQAVCIPVFANGDITTAQKAVDVLAHTGASGVMIGRAAQGNPWIFREINALIDNPAESCGLFTGKSLKLLEAKRVERLIINHLLHIHTFYSSYDLLNVDSKAKNSGNFLSDLSIKVARKHICWYFEQLKLSAGLTNKGQSSFTKDPDHLLRSNEQILSTIENKDAIRATSVVLETARSRFNKLESQSAQLDFLLQFFGELHTIGDKTT
jgi:tRNA-dihydrouridine synthase B